MTTAYRTLLCCFLCSSSIISPSAGIESRFLISTDHVGPLAIGMPVEQVYPLLGKEKVQLKDIDSEGMFSPALLWPCDNDQRVTCLVLEIDKQKTGWSIFRIRVNDPRYQTAEGIHIRSTLADVTAAYPKREILSGEGRVFAAVEPKGISFQLDADDPHLVTNQTRVTSILLFSKGGS